MVIHDEEHHQVAKKLLNRIGIMSRNANNFEDINSIGDRFIGQKEIPLGLKRRGQNSGKDFNLSAWSRSNGDLPEFATAGNKHYLYWNKFSHVLIKFPEQSILNDLLPDQWKPIFGEGNFKWLNDHSGVRRNSAASDIQQGVVFVPDHLVEIKIIWDLNENIQYSDKQWLETII